MVSTIQHSAPMDWSDWHLTDEEDMGEGCEQGEIIRLLLSVLTQLLAERDWRGIYLGADNFFGWVEEQPLVRVSPDIYLVSTQLTPPMPSSWQMWRDGHHPPLLAVEIVSDATWKKDYQDAPLKYAQLGAQELLVFDPEAGAHTPRFGARVPFQLFIREADGSFVCRERGPGPVYSRVLQAHFCQTHDGAAKRVRISRTSDARELIPTVEEARDAALQDRDAAQEARNAAIQRAEEAEAELRALRLELERA